MISSLLDQIVALYQAHPVAQIVGLCAMILCCASYQGRTPKQILALQGGAGVLWMFHLVALGAYTGGFLNMLGAVRSVVYINNGRKRWASSPVWPYVFAGICIAVAAWSGIFQGEGWLCLLAMAAQGWACFVLRSKRARVIRFCSVGISLLWLIYDFLSGSIPGTLCEIINQISLYVAIFRYRHDRA